MNKTPEFVLSNRSINNSNNLGSNLNDNTNITNNSSNKNFGIKIDSSLGLDSDNIKRQTSRIIMYSRQQQNRPLSRSSNSNFEGNNKHLFQENLQISNNLAEKNSTNSLNNNLINFNKSKDSTSLGSYNLNINENIPEESELIQSKISNNSLKKKLTLTDNINFNSISNNLSNKFLNSSSNNDSKNDFSDKKIEVLNYAKLKSYLRKDDEEDDGIADGNNKRNLSDKLSRLFLEGGGKNNPIDLINNNNSSNNSLANPKNSGINNVYINNFNFNIGKNPQNLQNILNNTLFNNANPVNSNIKSNTSDINGNLAQINSIQNNTNYNSNNNKSVKADINNKKVAFRSLAGKTEQGSTKTNQDNYLIMDNILNCEDFRIYGVFDGHGKLFI